MSQNAVLYKQKKLLFLAKATKSVILYPFTKNNNVFHNVHWPGVQELALWKTLFCFVVLGEGGVYTFCALLMRTQVFLRRTVQYFELAALVNWAGKSGWPQAWADLADFLGCSLAAPAAGCFCLPRLLLAAHQVPLAAECLRLLYYLKTPTISSESNQKCDTVPNKTNKTTFPQCPLVWSAGSWRYREHFVCVFLKGDSAYMLSSCSHFGSSLSQQSLPSGHVGS